MEIEFVVAQLTNLAAIHLDRNMLTGIIPESFRKFTGSVPDLYLSHNQLTRPVPKSLGNLDFTRLDLGDLSFIFGSNKTIQIVDFSRNMFEFDLSNVVFPVTLISLDLNHNKDFGSLPAGLTAVNLQFFNVSYNRLCGPIPISGKL
ncbi:Polygalacturonase inhibitor [Camellia lanceoleosa]|uniref:Polygalacturonase inhibitor n=1 Tax=Camellia lanceoleosa TaxID=1840588 RepID=A0ACC0G964_9ERIC|nr:Polygalacturonase inhibitor [Camellia lanceoleosa]